MDRDGTIAVLSFVRRLRNLVEEVSLKCLTERREQAGLSRDLPLPQCFNRSLDPTEPRWY